MMASIEIKRKKNSYVVYLDLTIKQITKNFAILFRVFTKHKALLLRDNSP